MSSRNRSIRRKIFLLLLLPLISLSALWGFVLNLTVAENRELQRAERLHQSVGAAAADLHTELQAERERSLTTLAVRDRTARGVTADLGAQRLRTDRAIARLNAEAGLHRDLGHADLRGALDRLAAQTDRLPAIRDGLSTGPGPRLAALAQYNRLIDTLFPVHDQLITLPDLDLYQQSAALQTMARARDHLAREQALVAGARLDARLTEAEATTLAEYATTRRFLQSRALATLDLELRQPYELAFGSRAFLDLAIAEARVRDSGAPVPEWEAAAGAAMATFDRLAADSARVLAARTATAATGVTVRIGVAAGAGVLAVLASIVVSVRFGRRLARELADLRANALELAEVRLPRLVERLRRGEEVDVRAETRAIQINGSTEIIDVGRAFAAVQRTAVEAAVGQAATRRGVNQVFLNLARRKQGLLHRQLDLLDGMQRRTHDPDRLDELFRLDHLTTRMRRHAEGLITLSGSVPGRVWRRPVPVLDIARAAVAEVEDYTRVQVTAMPGAAVDGSAAADLTHLIAELVENATLHSPPATPVRIGGDAVANGYAIEVEDHGPVLPPTRYAAINALLARPPELDLADSDRLGLFVVATLAGRHGVQVVLRARPAGGTTAIVLVPSRLIAEPAQSGPPAPIVVERVDTPQALPETQRKPSATAASGTHAGLPRRVRQASLAPQLRAPTPEREEERSPEQVKDLFSAFQRGTQRGRQEEGDA